jgi:hypothetical protein
MAKVKTEEEKFPYGKVKYQGKFIPKSKDGFPNGVYLGKEEKEDLKKYKADKKLEKKKGSLKEFMDILKGTE